MARLGGTGRQQGRLWLALAAVLVLHVVCWRAAAPLRSLAAARSHAQPHLAKRSWGALADEDDDHDAGEALIDWLALYRHAQPGAPRIALFALMVVWLTFLFAFVGICASEFFCPNLSHIASRLGLSESVVSRLIRGSPAASEAVQLTLSRPFAGWSHLPRLLQWQSRRVLDLCRPPQRLGQPRHRRAHRCSQLHRLGRRVRAAVQSPQFTTS